MSEIIIKTLKDIESFRRIEALQMEIWGMPERDVVPVHQLQAASGAGGAVIAAVDPDGAFVGFCYGFAGWRDGRPLFYSHMAGVLGGRQLQEVGFRLKCAQRQAAIAMAYDRAVWTYDPLQSVNARFNMHKLGATACRYYVNYYGDMPDELNRGMESDRIEVDWELCSRRVEDAMSGRAPDRAWPQAPHALRAEPATSAPADPELGIEAPVVLLEIPTDFPAVRLRDQSLTQAWRVASREAFLHYFGRGYRAVDFLLHRGERLRGEYVLSRETSEEEP
ncbi:MAG: GNAT family N-acetyltransferase [Armatimonadetes bacterium]|nr:GNAT family N-acetyltransferase [Armatimonadota bacterium]